VTRTLIERLPRRHASLRALRLMAAHPGRFVLGCLRAFRANQGLLLAGAVAYYALLSIVPLSILIVIALSHWVAPEVLLPAIGRTLGWLLPGQAGAVTDELQRFLAHREVLGWVLLATMVFFSSLAFSVLENALSIIFHHRVKIHRRHALASMLMPYGFILCLTAGVLLVTVVAGELQAVATRSVAIGPRVWSLASLSGALLYLLGVIGEVLVLTAIYLVMPAGGLRPTHALIGAVVATALWEVSRAALLWYFATLSQIGAVYGALTSSIAVLLSLEVGGTLLLFGAQVIAEFERLGRPATQGLNDKAT
jgi:membrane protein